MGLKVAVVGATGNVGREMLDILSERGFPADEVVAIASRRSQGTEVSFGDRTLKVQALENYDFKGTDIALMSAGGAVSKEWSPKIAAQGCVVIDNSSAWRYDLDVPLIVPEVNANAVEGFRRKNIIANPNCSTAQLVVALKPLHDRAKIKRVVVATYQSVSGAGKDAMDELFNQTRAVFVADTIEAKKFTKRIAFNVIPHIDVFMEDGTTKEEWKMMVETKKILDPKIKVSATCVRVPVFVGHSEAVNIEFENPITAEEARDILRESPGCLVVDKHEDGGYVTPYECAGEDATYISRIREDQTVENGLSLWIVSDNLRKGAALNAIQIAELLLNRGLIAAKKAADAKTVPAGPRLLVTGFGPFPGASENPTTTLVESLAGEPAERFGAGVFRAEILPTEYRRSWSVMRGLNASFSPDVVVHFGLSGRAEAITIECVARRRIDPARPDAVGYAPPLGVARGSGPDIVRCDWPANEIAGLLTHAGFPAVISEDAGGYVCNATFYRSLRARHAARRVVGFVHVPPAGRNGLTRARLQEAATLVLKAASDAWRERLRAEPHAGDYPASGSMR